MRAIRHTIAALVFVLFASDPALAQTPVATAAVPANPVEAVCASHFSVGTSYAGYEYRDGRNVSITIKYKDCIEMAATHGTMKVMLTFERQEAGAALDKQGWLEFYVESANQLRWRNMSGMYREKSRLLVLNQDGSYHEHLEYMRGGKTATHYKRTK